MVRFKLILYFIGFLTLSPGNAQDSLTIGEIPIDDSDSMSVTAVTSSNLAITQAFVVSSAEDRSRRWLNISPGIIPESKGLATPTIETDANKGTFSFVLSGVDSGSYLGNRMLRENGHFPIHFEVAFSNPEEVTIKGRTLPFDDVNCFYSFVTNEYVVELIFVAPQSAPKPNDKIITRKSSNKQVQGNESKPGRTLAAARNTSISDLRAKIIDVVFIAAGALGLVILLLLIILLIKKITQKNGQGSEDFSQVLAEKTTSRPHASQTKNRVEGETARVETREEKVRRIMETQNISYDEAALRIDYEMMSENND